MKKTTVSILALILCALYSVTPLLNQPEFTFGEDIGYHINWAYQVSLGIKEGILYPRWLSTSNGGYGSPTTIFYAPLFYCLTGFLSLAIPSLIVSLKVVTLLGFLLSGISMYIFLRNFCGHVASVTGGVIYQLFPYHIFDLYYRGTFAETFAFAWLPLIFHFIYKGFAKDTLPNWLGMAFSYAGLVLTHIASAYIFTFVIVAFALFLSLPKRSFSLFLKFILASFFGLSLSAVYFIPMVFEQKFVHIEFLTEVQFGDYTRNFLFMAENSDNLFHINLEKIVMLMIFSVVFSLLIVYYRSRRYKDLPNLPLFVFFSWLFAFSLFISTPFSMPIWKIVPGLPTIQFPWRWVLVSALSASILVGLTSNAFSLADIQRDRFIRVSLAVFQVFVVGNLYFSSMYIIKARPLQEKEMEWILKEGGDVIEYRPIWITKREKEFSREEQIPVVFKEGEGKVDVMSWNSQSRLFRVNALTPSTLRVSTFYYPGWRALINGVKIPIGIEKDTGVMLLNLPAGDNTVLLEFSDTPLRRTAKWISFLSLISVPFMIGMRWIKGFPAKERT